MSEHSVSAQAAAASPAREKAQAGQLGLPAAIALIMGSIIGIGLFSALAQLKWGWIDEKQGSGARFLRDSIVAVAAIVFSVLFIVYSRNTGAQGKRSIGQIFHHDWGSWAEWMQFVLVGVALLVGIPVYKRRRGQMTAPDSVPPYR